MRLRSTMLRVVYPSPPHGGGAVAVCRGGGAIDPLLQRYLATAASRFWLFDGRRGEHLSVRAAQDAVPKYLHRVRPDLRVHDLRHVALTTLLRASGGDVWLAAHMAGHADTRQIMRVYGHHLVKDSLRAAGYMAAALTTKREGA